MTIVILIMDNKHRMINRYDYSDDYSDHKDEWSHMTIPDIVSIMALIVKPIYCSLLSNKLWLKP